MSSDVIYQRVRQITCANCKQVINVAMQKPFTQFECPHCKAKLNVPAMLGPFMLLEVLGTGGMGAVYKAVDQSLGRFVAIKVMKKQLGDDQKLVESFLREARAAAALNHANIVQIYSCGEQQGQPYIAMELVSGGRLDLMMEGGQQIEETRLLQIAIDVANGLSAANEVNLVHGDIKPANILFDKHGVAKIVDFGLAQFVNRSQEKGEIWGTPYYISPERARGGKADHRSDIYSLGATLYHALSGKPPFDGPTASDVVVARLRQPVPDILELRSDLHPQTVSLINRMMAGDVSVRYPTSASLMADMKEALAASKTKLPAGRSSSAAAAKAEGAAPQKNKTTAIIGAVVGLVVVGGAIAYFASGKKGGKEAPPPPVPVPLASNVVPPPPPPPVQQGPGETFFTKDEGSLVLAMQFSPTDPMMLVSNLQSFSSSVPEKSGRKLWVKLLEGFGWRMAGREVDAADPWTYVANAQLASGEHPNAMPRAVGRFLMAQMSPAEFAAYCSKKPSWYGDFAALFQASEMLQRQKYVDSRALLDRYANAPNKEPSWPFAMQGNIKTWLTVIDKFRNDAVPAKNRGDQNAVRSAWDEAKKGLPPLFHKLDPNTVLSDVGTGSPAANKAAAEADRKLIDQALEAEKGGSMTKRDYTTAADNLVALNQKLATREGREHLAAVVNRLDRMDAVKNILINGAKTAPCKERTDLGGDFTAADANGFKAGGKQRPWTEISNGTMAQIAAFYVNSSSAEDRKKADDLASIAVFCSMNGDGNSAKKFADQARAKDKGADATLQKLLTNP